MRVVLVAFLALLSGIFALSNGLDLFFRLSYLLIGLLVLGWTWARVSIAGVSVRMPSGITHTTMGQHAGVNVVVSNNHFLLKPWLEVRVESDLPMPPVPHVLQLSAGDSQTLAMDFYCGRRGRYTLGPIRVTSGDPFGLFKREIVLDASHYIVVYPETVDLPRFFLPPADLPGEGRHRRRTHFITPNAAGIREYVFGDSYNRIHWASTARNGKLMVKEFELDPASETWIILDLQRAVQAGSGLQSTEEYAITLAASVAKIYLESNRPLGLLSYGRTLEVYRPERGGHQLARLMETFALAEARGDVPLSNLLAAEAGRFGKFSTLLVITPSVDETWAHQLENLMRRGARPSAIFLEADTFGGKESSLLVTSSLLASGVQTYSLKRHGSIQQAVQLLSTIAEGGREAEAERERS